MSLTYLSGDADEIGKGKLKKAFNKTKQNAQNVANKAQHAIQPKRSQAERKQARKRVFKKVAKVAVAPARKALLLAINTNAMKVATKLVRTWKKPAGKADILKFWGGLGGDPNQLIAAIKKGSKQQIAGDRIGVVGIAAGLTAATPLLVALIDLFKKHKTGGDAKEMKEFDQGLDIARKALANDESVPKGEVSMPQDSDVGLVADKDGNSVQDPKYNTADEKSSGGYEGEIPPDKGESAPGSGSEGVKASSWSPLGFFFMLAMYAGLYKFPGRELMQSYCLLAMLCIPLAISERAGIVQRLAYGISFGPMNLINRTLKIFSHAKTSS